MSVQKGKALFEQKAPGFPGALPQLLQYRTKKYTHIVVGEKAPEVCPACNHPQSYFEIHAENY